MQTWQFLQWVPVDRRADVVPKHLGIAAGVVVRASADAPITAGSGGAQVLMLQGRPIGEPVAQYGPFVMNTRAEIHQAIQDLESGTFLG